MHVKRDTVKFAFERQPHVLVVRSPYHKDVVEELSKGVFRVLEDARATFEVIDVPGALEIPAAIAIAVKSLGFVTTRRRFDGYIALGCVIKGETQHDEIVGYESAHGLQELALRYTLAVGNGILTCNSLAQAFERASVSGQDKGGGAAEACLRMIELKQQYGLSPKKRRWWRR